MSLCFGFVCVCLFGEWSLCNANVNISYGFSAVIRLCDVWGFALWIMHGLHFLMEILFLCMKGIICIRIAYKRKVHFVKSGFCLWLGSDRDQSIDKNFNILKEDECTLKCVFFL